jgi:hypothetical protein
MDRRHQFHKKIFLFIGAKGLQPSSSDGVIVGTHIMPRFSNCLNVSAEMKPKIFAQPGRSDTIAAISES